ncbi:MAG: hypothetical protein J6Z35_03865 [Lachnospiraceae bacterium]|nr:hypothetical protein [Lachnospiraceae bacterium]
MRITNKIMQRNNLANINTNKVYQDNLSTQMSTQKKISKASEDPVVAIRALRLRSNVTEVTQYYSKNIPDAKSWLEITEDALKNQSQVMTNMIEQCTKGANGDLTSSDRKIILEQIKALADEVYATANADYAGRYVFTGYRTDTSVSFKEAGKTDYAITEQINPEALDSVTSVETGNLTKITESNYMDAAYNGITEDAVSSANVHRIRLSYENCNADETPAISYQALNTAGTGYEWTEWTDAVTMHSYENPYAAAAADDDALIFVPETGEMLLGKNRYDALMAVADDVATAADESEIRVNYHKNVWNAGDLRPEHYFYCEADGLKYNEDYLTAGKERQDIEYDVGFNQTVRVNSTADECFQHGIGRTADDLLASLDQVIKLDELKNTLKSALKSVPEGSAEAKTLNTQLQAVDKAYTMAKDKNQKLFEKGITVFQKYLDDASLSITNCGNRSKKLELIENRMQNQKTTFETLKSENEDVDITEVAIHLSSAGLTYQAALMATDKIAQTTLLNYI